MVYIGNSWDGVLKDVFESENYTKLREFLKAEYGSHRVYPPMFDIFNAIKYTDLPDVKVVILGQDPYHNPGQAHGLAFSVQEGVQPPPSLKNIYAELNRELGVAIPNTGCLVPWTKRGVLLLNTVLTVRENSPTSHAKKGWEQVTDAIISAVDRREGPVAFLLWGSNAAAKRELLTNPDHLVLTAPHPSPLSANRGFFGCGHFLAVDRYLTANGFEPMDWSL